MTTNQGIVGNFDYVVETPEELIFSYSRHVYFRLKLTKDNAPVVGQEVRLIISPDSGVTFSEYRYTGVDGDVVFDASRMLQVATNSREREISSIDYQSYTPWDIANFDIKLVIHADDMSYIVPAIFTRFRVVNGAHDNVNDWRAKPIRLKHWTEYPFTFDFPNLDIISVSSNGSTYVPVRGFRVSYETLQLVRYTMDDLYLPNMTSRLWIMTPQGIVMKGDKLSQDYNTIVMEIDRQARDDRKIYLRWMGDYGEVFYWLFDNISEEQQIKTSVYQRALVDDIFRGNTTNKMRDNGVVRDTSTTTTRTIATDYLDVDYFNIVSSVAKSPYVDMFIDDENDGKWQRVNIAAVTFTRSLKTSDKVKNNRIVLKIEMPEI
jgi:hypothetical protein